MQYKVFTLPVFDSVQIEDELNKFLRSHKVVSVEKKLIENDGHTHWSFLIEYLCGNQTSGGNTNKGAAKI